VVGQHPQVVEAEQQLPEERELDLQEVPAEQEELQPLTELQQEELVVELEMEHLVVVQRLMVVDQQELQEQQIQVVAEVVHTIRM
tara:strand:+ start:317 stop:571 length:255 start_codon:yes stop_codon:yes gene_type:complete